MDIIILSTADWDNPFWTNKQHVAVTLAKMGHRVLYVDSLGLRRPSASNSDFGRIKKRLFKFFRGIQSVAPNIWVISPIAIPLQRFNLIRKFNLAFLKRLLLFSVKYLSFSEPILWTYSPIMGDLIGILQEKVSIYHCVDEIKAQPGMPADEIERCEKELLQKVNLVFTTSRSLEQVKRQYHKNVFYMPNVADFEHFNTAHHNMHMIPNDLKKITDKPIVGFIGAISGYKLDLKLIEYTAQNMRECNFVFIGKVGEGDPWTDISNLRKHPNIFFLGPKSYQVLPHYLQYFNVCILPCNLNEYTFNMFPMKFFEYLAAGKPVVSTKLPSLEEYPSLCYLCDSYSDFVRAIRECLVHRDNELINAGLNEAKKHTYLNRTEKMLSVILSFCNRKGESV